jgi:hypothetical protein
MLIPVTTQPVLHENKRADMVIAPSMNMGAVLRMSDSTNPKIPRLKNKKITVADLIETGIGRNVISSKMR